MTKMSILTDVTRCIGCEQCVQACKKVNNTGEDKPWRWQRKIDDLSATRWTTIVPRPGSRFVRRQCRHCLEPACVSVCPVGAMHKTPEGPVVYNSDICMGCRYCMMACPYGVPRYTWSSAVPYVRKCIMCYDKIKSGELKQPACTEACPSEATVYGGRDDLLVAAHRKIGENPDIYLPKVFGEHEVGGTSVLYISDIDLGFLAWNENPGDAPLPRKTWVFLNKVPGIFVGVGAVMGGVYWVIDRRMRLQAESASAAHAAELKSEKRDKTESAEEKDE
jgi:formate dehydrogenase iron-sulfur subunit